MKIYRFNEKVYEPPFTPYYDRYKDHLFMIDHYHPDPDAADDHVWMTCLTDSDVLVDGYVHLDVLEEVQREEVQREEVFERMLGKFYSD